jgi:hypothetical protein
MQLPGSFRRVWTLVLLALAAPALAGADECVECTSKKLCDPHGVLERTTLREANAAWKKAAPAERVEWLARVAALTAAHDNAPSKTVVTFLARAVEDEDEGVRERAFDLLATGQHPEAALNVLTAFIDKQIAWMDKPPPKLNEKLRPSTKPLEEMTPKEHDEQRKRLTHLIAEANRIAAYYEDLLRRHAECARVLQRIARRGDESARTTTYFYFKLLSRYCVGSGCGGCSAALLELGDHKAFELVIAGLDSYDGDGRPSAEKGHDGKPKPIFGPSVVAALDAARIRYHLPEPAPQPSGLARDVWREWLRENGEALGKR